MFTRREILFGVTASALGAGVITLVPEFQKQVEQQAEMLAHARQRHETARARLLATLKIDGTCTLYKSDGTVTADVNNGDIAIWHGAPDQLTVMPLSGVNAGIAVTFLPVDRALKITRYAELETYQTLLEKLSWPEALSVPVKETHVLDDYGSEPNSSRASPNTRFLYTRMDGAFRQYRVTGDIMRGKPFEIFFGRQHKLALNLGEGYFVFNTMNQKDAFYGRFPGLTPEPVTQQANALRP